jgi:hypothetical protein
VSVRVTDIERVDVSVYVCEGVSVNVVDTVAVSDTLLVCVCDGECETDRVTVGLHVMVRVGVKDCDEVGVDKNVIGVDMVSVAVGVVVKEKEEVGLPVGEIVDVPDGVFVKLDVGDMLGVDEVEQVSVAEQLCECVGVDVVEEVGDCVAV